MEFSEFLRRFSRLEDEFTSDRISTDDFYIALFDLCQRYRDEQSNKGVDVDE